MFAVAGSQLTGRLTRSGNWTPGLIGDLPELPAGTGTPTCPDPPAG